VFAQIRRDGAIQNANQRMVSVEEIFPLQVMDAVKNRKPLLYGETWLHVAKPAQAANVERAHLIRRTESVARRITERHGERSRTRSVVAAQLEVGVDVAATATTSLFLIGFSPVHQ
jgi:hypothetical protein